MYEWVILGDRAIAGLVIGLLLSCSRESCSKEKQVGRESTPALPSMGNGLMKLLAKKEKLKDGSKVEKKILSFIKD